MSAEELSREVRTAATAPARTREAWPRPTFKEIGAAVLSVVLVLICVPVIVTVIGQIDAKPIGVKVGEATVIVDGYDRAKQLLGIVFPLLTATITFWLGVAVEGRRADANGKAASDATDERDAAHAQRDEASRREQSTRAAAVEAIAEIENALGSPASRPGSGPIEYRGAQPPPVPALDLDHLRGVVSAAKSRLLA